MFWEKFESKKIRNMRLEHLRKTCELQGEIEYYRAHAQETAHTCHFLAERMDRDCKELASVRTEKERLHQLLKSADSAIKELKKERQELIEAYDRLDEEYHDALKELDEIYKEHETVIRELRDSQHISAEVNT